MKVHGMKTLNRLELRDTVIANGGEAVRNQGV